MAKFVWHPNGEPPKAFVLRGTRISIGRDAGADMRVDEPSVSTRHAMAVVAGSSVTLHDLESRNGTWVNGERIQLCTLKHGDVVQFGRLKATYVDESQAASSSRNQGGARTLTATERRAGANGPLVANNPSNPKPLETPPPALAADFEKLDKVLNAMREHRRLDAKGEDARTKQLKTEWQHTMQYATALKAKLADEPRVRFFEISERRNEVVLRVEKSAALPMHLIQITLGHADRASDVIDGIWLRQSGSQDSRYDDHTGVMREVVASLAALLA